ncbi:hypothetical protein EOL96_07070 [Candidatus Saccharibacteria bacterium]|nr:hypothetical protein [Candidatus Saccharibacteria bacterium]
MDSTPWAFWRTLVVYAALLTSIIWLGVTSESVKSPAFIASLVIAITLGLMDIRRHFIIDRQATELVRLRIELMTKAISEQRLKDEQWDINLYSDGSVVVVYRKGCIVVPDLPLIHNQHDHMLYAPGSNRPATARDLEAYKKGFPLK